MKNDALYDTISNLNFYVLEGSSFEGAILCDNTYNVGYEGDGIMNVYVDTDYIWHVTANSLITGTLYLEGNIESAKFVGTEGTVYFEGEGFTVLFALYFNRILTGLKRTLTCIMVMVLFLYKV